MHTLSLFYDFCFLAMYNIDYCVFINLSNIRILFEVLLQLKESRIWRKQRNRVELLGERVYNMLDLSKVKRIALKLI